MKEEYPDTLVASPFQFPRGAESNVKVEARLDFVFHSSLLQAGGGLGCTGRCETQTVP